MDKNGLQHLVCVLKSFFGSEKAEKNKGNIAYFLQSWPHALSVLYCVFFFAPYHCFITATDQRQGPAAVQENAEDEKSRNLSNMLLQILNYILICIYMEIYAYI